MGTRNVRIDDRRVAAAVQRWFARHARDLPWRASPRDPYRSLVSEVMLQQTQVARVLPRYRAFLEAFPGIADLAAADEQEVLAAWSGLGYYRRARLLHAAAKAVMRDHAGRLPESAPALRELPGVGPYTAGAIGSMVYGRPEPIVDGNVARVLMRFHGRPGRHQDADVMRWAWRRSAGLVASARDPGAFNEGMMELGAVVCTPRAPRCSRCPLARACAARAAGRQEVIPAPKAGVRRAVVHCAAVVVRDPRGRLLVRRRGVTGLWAGMWEAPTMESASRPSRDELSSLGLVATRRAESFVFMTTHRVLRFDVWEGRCEVVPAGAAWKTRAQASRLPMSAPQRRVLLSRGVPGGVVTRQRS